jgi:hypothetical protein
MTKHLIILAELDGNEISRDIVSIDRYRQEDYKQPSLLYWVAKPTPENKLQYEYPLRDYSTIHSLSRNEAYFFKWQFGKDPNNLNMYTYNFGGAYYENKYDSICLVQKEDPEPTEFKMWRRLKSFAQFKNPDNKIMIEKINKVLQEAAQDYLDSGFYEEIDAKTAFDDDLSRELRIAFGAYNRSYTPLFDGSYIIVNDVNRVSVYLYNWGFNEIVNFNGAGDIITLDDIFKVDEEIYLQRLVDISKETIFNDDMDSYYPPSYDESRWDFGTDGLKNNCAIGKDFIIVFHGIIASQASGEHMVVIPFSMLGDILEDEYK